ncbi:hypothetical protein [uncultured Pontibacter sp.]|uniref:hypothetical protein n=1 Tax=uncultured Pontibacter sp. TaxID=453356 RepID=UPI002603BB44|nr:hypothetical protein [uncultured Pontibacter sp.]
MMKTIFPLLALCLVFLSGCAITSTSTAKVQELAKPYVGIMTLVTDIDTDFNQLDSATYEQHIRGKFNNLENLKYRKHLEKTLARNLEQQQQVQTRIVKSSDVFELNANVSYSEFLEKIRATGVDGILLVNLRNYWYTNDYTTVHFDHVSTTTTDTEPSAVFYTYLLDSQTLHPVWFADSMVQGISAGYDTLHNHLARSISRKLRKDKYIMAKY